MTNRPAITDLSQDRARPGTVAGGPGQGWTGPSPAHVGSGCLHHWIEDQVRRTPCDTALIHEGGEITYRDLDRRANRVAACLRSLGIGTEDLVGVALDRSPELVVSLLGILKAGGAYVPLDPDLPDERLRFMARDSDAKVILTQPSREESLTVPGTALVRTEDIWLEGDGEGVDVQSDEADLAYVLYTSGSTGRPKGVMIEHRSIVNRLFWMQEQYGIGPDDVVVHKTPFGFDVSLWELFWPLMVGARMAIARAGGHKDAGYLARLVEETGATVMHFVPSMLELFLEAREVGSRCRTLRHVICSGEALTQAAVHRFYARMPAGVDLWNLYGPTEAAVDVTFWKCRPGAEGRTVPIGVPVANTAVHVVDDDLEEVPVGDEGELLIGGVQVGRGYWGRPDLTEAAFVPDPFATDPEARAYRTGDRGRRLENGVLEFLGRVDHQVKIRGVRIELGEVEAVLREQPGVHQAAAVVVDGSGGEKHLVGYVVPDGPSGVDSAVVRAGAARRLPEAMVPSRIITLECMPLSPNGKLDRNALPHLPRERPGLDRPHLPARTALEKHLAEMWAETLGMERVGARDPFFELGGTSLDAARFVNRLQEELDEFLYVVTVFDAPTVEEYAAFLIRDYPRAVARLFGEQAVAAGGRRHAPRHEIDEERLVRFAAAVPTYPLRDAPAPTGLNERAVFILGPPRSGTTLLRVMLDGHPDLFAASELQLLHFETLSARREAFSGRFSAWLEGTLRVVMELRDCDADAARAEMEELEGRTPSVRAFYALLQDEVEGRILVDKSPSYALDPNALARAERDFRDPFYIQLVRHPYAMIESFVSRHMEQILFLHEHPFGPRELAEMVWLTSHRNVSNFLAGVPAHRHATVRFEDLVRRPAATMMELCSRMGIPFDVGVTQPYAHLEERMVDGIHDASLPMGDTHLLAHDHIDAALADRWKGVLNDDYLSHATWRLAESFGYRGRGKDPSDGDEAGASTGGPRGTHDDRQELRRRRLEARRHAGSEGD